MQDGPCTSPSFIHFPLKYSLFFVDIRSITRVNNNLYIFGVKERRIETLFLFFLNNSHIAKYI